VRRRAVLSRLSIEPDRVWYEMIRQSNPDDSRVSNGSALFASSRPVRNCPLKQMLGKGAASTTSAKNAVYVGRSG
jgi:hypothetical protein